MNSNLNSAKENNRDHYRKKAGGKYGREDSHRYVVKPTPEYARVRQRAMDGTEIEY